MNKIFYFIFISTLIFLSYIFGIDKKVSHRLSTINTNIKENYLKGFNSINDFISKYFIQAKQIEHLKKDILEKEKYKVLYLSHQNQIDNNISIKISKVISYVDFNNFAEVILDSNSRFNKIAALITNNGYSAGIIINKNNQNIGYLNHHPKSNYAVYIGNTQVPGITHGNKNKELITVKFIPLWQHIKIGDEVITSGMDNIFPKGIKVGKVIKIKKLSTNWEALVKPYANVYSKNYFYTYQKL